MAVAEKEIFANGQSLESLITVRSPSTNHLVSAYLSTFLRKNLIKNIELYSQSRSGRLNLFYATCTK